MKNATTATLTYDELDHLVGWNVGSTNQEWDAYDASGNRVLQHSTTGGGTSITTMPLDWKSTSMGQPALILATPFTTPWEADSSEP